MSRIKGLNDKVTLKQIPIKPRITVWKGERKSKNSAGKSLESLFRIEAPVHLQAAIRSAYNVKSDSNGSILVNHLNIVPAYEDEFKTFDSKMAAYNASRPISFCDRQTIHTKFIKDTRNYFQPVEANDLCPVAGTNHDCPNKCSRTGDFYFYIWELLKAGYGEFARLQVHGVKDNQAIADLLDQTKLEIGAIRESPFVSEETRTYIIYEMTRIKVQSKYPIKEGGKRTEKRGTKEDWVVNLNLAPVWKTKYDHWEQARQLQALNYQPSMRLIEQVHGVGMIAAGDAYQLPPAEKVEPIEKSVELKFAEFKQGLAIAYKNNAWKTEGWRTMMLETFKQTEITPDLDLELLKAIAESGHERDKYCEETIEPRVVWSMDDVKIQEVQSIADRNNWHKSALDEMLYSSFSIESGDFSLLAKEQYVSLQIYLADQSVKQEYGIV